jgi:sensor histidine kinase regulating citrate/malate metabolism
VGPARPIFDEGLKALGTVSVGETMNALKVALEAGNAGEMTEDKR